VGFSLNPPTAPSSSPRGEGLRDHPRPAGHGQNDHRRRVHRQAVANGDKVLACAPSNHAVDNLLEKLLAAGELPVRLGHPARIMPNLRTRDRHPRGETPGCRGKRGRSHATPSRCSVKPTSGRARSRNRARKPHCGAKHATCSLRRASSKRSRSSACWMKRGLCAPRLRVSIVNCSVSGGSTWW